MGGTLGSAEEGPTGGPVAGRGRVRGRGCCGLDRRSNRLAGGGCRGYERLKPHRDERRSVLRRQIGRDSLATCYMIASVWPRLSAARLFLFQVRKVLGTLPCRCSTHEVRASATLHETRTGTIDSFFTLSSSHRSACLETLDTCPGLLFAQRKGKTPTMFRTRLHTTSPDGGLRRTAEHATSYSGWRTDTQPRGGKCA